MWYVVQVIGGQEDAAVLKIQKQASNETFKTVIKTVKVGLEIVQKR